MKLFNIKSIMVAMLGLVVFTSCDDKDLLADNYKWTYLDSTNSANIKIMHVFAGNTPQIPTAPNLTTGPQVFIYANGIKLNGTALSYGGTLPIPNVYATVPSGTVNFAVVQARLNLNVVPNIPAPIAGDTLATFTQNLENGKYYSFYMGDTVPTVKFTIKEDIMSSPASGTYKIRLANMDMTDTDTLTLFSRRQNAELIQNITHKQVSDWVQVPLPIITDTLELRKKGSTAVYINVGGFTPSGLRLYTVTARGKVGVTSKTPTASVVTNR